MGIAPPRLPDKMDKATAGDSVANYRAFHNGGFRRAHSTSPPGSEAKVACPILHCANEAQVKAIDILPMGDLSRVASSDDHVDGLLCHDHGFRAAPCAQFVVP